MSNAEAQPVVAEELNIAEEFLVVFVSANGRDNWHPVRAEEVPDFVKRPEIMARLVAGEECMDCAEGRSGSSWYRAVRPSDLQVREAHAILAAEAQCEAAAATKH